MQEGYSIDLLNFQNQPIIKPKTRRNKLDKISAYNESRHKEHRKDEYVAVGEKKKKSQQ